MLSCVPSFIWLVFSIVGVSFLGILYTNFSLSSKSQWLMVDRLVTCHGLNNHIWIWAFVVLIVVAGCSWKWRNCSKEILLIWANMSLILLWWKNNIWSWFMPWNGDYTESDSHNGVAWWKKFFSYDYVITRDKMPSLK